MTILCQLRGSDLARLRNPRLRGRGRLCGIVRERTAEHGDVGEARVQEALARRGHAGFRQRAGDQDRIRGNGADGLQIGSEDRTGRDNNTVVAARQRLLDAGFADVTVLGGSFADNAAETAAAA